MKLLITTILILLLGAADATSQSIQMARGIVYHDLNANGRRDAREPGLPNVTVTNGELVVMTDAQGRYELPVGDDTIISVVKPGNYRYPVDENNLVKFFYIHKPNGSPQGLRYAGVAPTGPLPASIDFPLWTGNASDKFKIIAFADPQPYSEEEVGYFDASIVEELVGAEGYEFGISLGDLVGDRLDLFEPLNTAIARIGIPWYSVLGNHDLNFDVTEQHHADETFERVYGPANYAFYQGRVLFLQLDNVIYPNPYTSSNYTGGYRDDQLRWVRNLLDTVPNDYLIVVNGHIPIFDEQPHGDTFVDEHRERLFELLKDYRHTLSMSGHTHTQRHHFFDRTQGWMQDAPHHHYNAGTASGDWWSGAKDAKGIPEALMRDGTPKGYGIITFDGATYTIDYKVYDKPTEHRMKIYTPKYVPHQQGTRRFYRTQFIVNFFQGSEFDKLEYRIDDGNWMLMRYWPGEDPFVAEIRYELNNMKDQPDYNRMSNPAMSYHLWRGSVPAGLPVGMRTIEVRATDAWGRVFTESTTFEVVD